jgi:hypothetical protein
MSFGIFDGQPIDRSNRKPRFRLRAYLAAALRASAAYTLTESF